MVDAKHFYSFDRELNQVWDEVKVGYNGWGPNEINAYLESRGILKDDYLKSKNQPKVIKEYARLDKELADKAAK